MKNIWYYLIFICSVWSMEGCHRNSILWKHETKCLQNSDTLYDRREVLEKFASTLNSSIPEYKEVFEDGFYINNDGSAIGFFIYDLTDTINREIYLKECIHFINNHVYHFAPIRLRYSFSHIAILENEEIKFFKSINCNNRGDSVEDVLKYIDKKMSNDAKRIEVLQRVKSYRKYGDYIQTDSQSQLICN
jgi:hypothetical protein